MPIDGVRFSRQPQKTTVTVTGHATPGTTIVAENLSSSPWAPSGNQTGVSKTKVKSDGSFSLEVRAGREGDHLELSNVGKNGKKEKVQVTVDGVAPVDERRPETSNQKLRLVPSKTPGAYSFVSVSKNQRVGEPGEVLCFRNKKTHAETKITLDAKGQLPKGATLKGAPGDTYFLALSDGTHNKDFVRYWSAMVIPPTPDARGIVEPLPPAGTTGLKLVPFTGKLFVGGITPKDPQQGEIGDCYLISTLASIASARPDVIKNMIKDNKDGTFTVTFKKYDAAKKKYVNEPITVTNKFYEKDHTLNLGGSSTPDGRKKEELWLPVIEKAYAAWKGGYDTLLCGYPYEIFEATLGTEGVHHDVSQLSQDQVFKALKSAQANHQPVSGWTNVKAQGPFAGSNVIPDHAYSVLGVEEKNGVKSVIVRNPWGSFEPTGNGRDDGIFKLPLETFTKMFTAFGVGK